MPRMQHTTRTNHALNTARAAYHNGLPHELISSAGEGSPHNREIRIKEALDIPSEEKLSAAKKTLVEGLTTAPLSVDSYYDDTRSNNYNLPYNKENLIEAVTTLTAGKDTGWLDEKFKAMTGENRDVPAQVTGRQVIERLAMDLTLPKDAGLVHALITHVPRNDPYWDKKTEEPANPLFTHSFPYETNLFQFMSCEMFYTDPANYAESVTLIRDIARMGEEITGKEDPLSLKDPMFGDWNYYKDMAQQVANSYPEIRSAWESYLEEPDTGKFQEKLTELDESDKSKKHGTRIASHFMTSFIVLPDPESDTFKMVASKIKEGFLEYDRKKETPSKGGATKEMPI